MGKGRAMQERDAAGQFRLFISSLGARLTAAGFKRKGSSFYIKRDCNVGILNVQKSRWNTKEQISFTINVGIFCNRIAQFVDGVENDHPCVWDCHLKQRIGFLMPDKKDMWWSLTSEEAPGLREQVASLVSDIAIPYVQNHMSDDALYALWMAGECPGVRNVQRGVFLSTLAKLDGKEADLRKACQELRDLCEGKPFAGAVELHIRRLGL